MDVYFFSEQSHHPAWGKFDGMLRGDIPNEHGDPVVSGKLLNQYLDSLLEDLRRSAEGNRMSRLTLKAGPVEIDPDRAVAIGIIVNELVMNAVKYAYPDGPGPIHVELKVEGDELVLSISDDGVGLAAKSDPRSTGMGQRIVAAMASKLDASVERDPAHTGTRMVLRFRRSPAPPQNNASAAAS